MVVPGWMPNASWVAVPAVMLNEALVAVLKTLVVAGNQYPLFVLFSVSVENVATPPTAATVVVPPRVLPPGFAPSAMPPLPTLFPYTTLFRSSARTFTAGLIWWPAMVVPGWMPNASWVAVPAVIVNELLVVELHPVAVAVILSYPPVFRSVSVENVATPPTAATVVVPPKVLPPGLLPSATVTGPVKLGTTLLAASSALTCTAGLIAAPATVVDGCTVNTSWVAVPEIGRASGRERVAVQMAA